MQPKHKKLTIYVLVTLLLVGGIAFADSKLIPSENPDTPTSYTLNDVYNFIPHQYPVA